MRAERRIVAPTGYAAGRFPCRSSGSSSSAASTRSGSWVAQTTPAALPRRRAQQLAATARGVRLVEPGGRLVDEQQRRLGRQRAGDGHALALAGRQPPGALAEPLAEADPRQPAPARRRPRPRRAAQPSPSARSRRRSGTATSPGPETPGHVPAAEARPGPRGRARPARSRPRRPRPRPGRSRPASSRSSVLFPEPERPVTAAQPAARRSAASSPRGRRARAAPAVGLVDAAQLGHRWGPAAAAPPPARPRRRQGRAVAGRSTSAPVLARPVHARADAGVATQLLGQAHPAAAADHDSPAPAPRRASLAMRPSRSCTVRSAMPPTSGRG